MNRDENLHIRGPLKNYLIIHIYSFSHILSSFLLYRYIWSKISIIFVILMLSLVGIDIKIVKILSFNFRMFLPLSGAFRPHGWNW